MRGERVGEGSRGAPTRGRRPGLQFAWRETGPGLEARRPQGCTPRRGGERVPGKAGSAARGLEPRGAGGWAAGAPEVLVAGRHLLQ